jgi:hypothetical protein
VGGHAHLPGGAITSWTFPGPLLQGAQSPSHNAATAAQTLLAQQLQGRAPGSPSLLALRGPLAHALLAPAQPATGGSPLASTAAAVVASGAIPGVAGSPKITSWTFPLPAAVQGGGRSVGPGSPALHAVLTASQPQQAPTARTPPWAPLAPPMHGAAMGSLAAAAAQGHASPGLHAAAPGTRPGAPSVLAFALPAAAAASRVAPRASPVLSSWQGPGRSLQPATHLPPQAAPHATGAAPVLISWTFAAPPAPAPAPAAVPPPPPHPPRLAGAGKSKSGGSSVPAAGASPRMRPL